ncbi:MAG TPA: glycosyltransferase [Candidatus Paceibacterota bacterium]|nr:glycosyltransferase [Candidatus Paceibacterota bacterium]
MKPQVFIGMPVYNGERHLSEAIESILNQTFGDFVLFISDDASKDATRTLCERYAAQDTRIIYYRQPQNIGMFANFKYVLDKAATPYFMWAAQDDIRAPEYLRVCVEKLERNPELGLATTATALIDTYGRELAVENEAAHLSGAPGALQVMRYVLQPEGFGKCNLTYGLFRTSAARAIWQAYPWKKVWGQDYHFALALVSRYEVFIDKRPLFKKRLGGYSSPELLEDKGFRKLSYQERNNDFPLKRFGTYFRGHMEATRGTPYQLLVAALLLVRLPRPFIVYAKERNYKKFLKKLPL